MKLCKKCNIEKNLNEFHKDKYAKNGYKSFCKICENLRKKEFYIKNKDKLKKKSLENYYNNIEEKKYYIKIYQKNNREKINNRIKNRILNEPLYKMTSNIRKLILLSIKRYGYRKHSKTFDILGCSFVEFKLYIEKQFQPWMTWDNHGLYNGNYEYGWDIDHIIPLSNATNEEERIKLNHYTNLQPLCSKINRDIKRDSLTFY